MSSQKSKQSIRAREPAFKTKHLESAHFEPAPQLSVDQAGWLARICRVSPLLIFSTCILGTILAALFNENTFSVIFVAINVYIFLFMCNTAVGGVRGIRAVKKWRQRDWQTEHYEAEQKALDSNTQPVEHFIIIPNYKEDEGTLQETLEALADCRASAERVRVCLAFEAREGSQGVAKAERLVERFSGRFRQLFATFHPAGLPNELPGKSSNEQWAFRECVSRARRDKLDLTRTTVTTGDADCLWHPEYFAALGIDMMSRNVEESNWLIWQPPQFLFRNFHAVPCITRALGITCSLYEIGGLGGCAAFGQHFSFSSYSMSMQLCSHVNGWDTDVIAEDHHMFVKCAYSSMYATMTSDSAPRTRVVPMYLPVKSTMVEGPDGASTVSGYVRSVKERYTQARRHMQGVSEIAYAMLHYLILNKEFGTFNLPLNMHWRAWQIVHTMFGTHLMPFIHVTTLVMSNYLFAKHFLGADGVVDTSQCASVPTPWDSFGPLEDLSHEMSKPFGGANMFAACYLFHYAPYVSIPPAILMWIGGGAMLLDYLYCAADDRVDAERAPAPPYQTYSKSDGGRPACAAMKTKLWTTLQLITEMVTLSPLIVIGFAMIPEACAVWSVAWKGNALQYITAAKPTLSAADMGAGAGPNDSVRTCDNV